MLSSSVMSSCTALRFSPSLRAISLPVARSREPITTRWPRSASWRATSRPMPRFPPEMKRDALHCAIIAVNARPSRGRRRRCRDRWAAAADALARAGVDALCFEAAEPWSRGVRGLACVFRHAHDRADLVELASCARRGWGRAAATSRASLSVGDEGVLFTSPEAEDLAALLAEAGLEHRVVDEEEQRRLLPRRRRRAGRRCTTCVAGQFTRGRQWRHWSRGSAADSSGRKSVRRPGGRRGDRLGIAALRAGAHLRRSPDVRARRAARSPVAARDQGSHAGDVPASRGARSPRRAGWIAPTSSAPRLTPGRLPRSAASRLASRPRIPTRPAESRASARMSRGPSRSRFGTDRHDHATAHDPSLASRRVRRLGACGARLRRAHPSSSRRSSARCSPKRVAAGSRRSSGLRIDRPRSGHRIELVRVVEDSGLGRPRRARIVM